MKNSKHNTKFCLKAAYESWLFIGIVQGFFCLFFVINTHNSFTPVQWSGDHLKRLLCVCHSDGSHNATGHNPCASESAWWHHQKAPAHRTHNESHKFALSLWKRKKNKKKTITWHSPFKCLKWLEHGCLATRKYSFQT